MHLHSFPAILRLTVLSREHSSILNDDVQTVQRTSLSGKLGDRAKLAQVESHRLRVLVTGCCLDHLYNESVQMIHVSGIIHVHLPLILL